MLLTDLEGYTDEGLTASPVGCDGAACSPVADAEAGAADVRAEETSVEKPDGGCPSGRGPEMVRVMGFCIDSTEVTVGQYTAFLTSVSDLPDRGLGSQPAKCAGNADYKPAYWYPESEKEKTNGVPLSVVDTMPVGVVDWCDARAFCAWSGKRLCGKVGGGPVPPAMATTVNSEWYVACSHNGVNAFPNASSYIAGACNDNVTNEVAGRKPVKSSPQCTGGYPGLLDMSGNLKEWINACSVPAGDGGIAQCETLGGAWNFPPTALGCESASGSPATARARKTGSAAARIRSSTTSPPSREPRSPALRQARPKS